MNDSASSLIQEVWENNLEEEFSKIRSLLSDYPYVSMDTEFPGVVARPMGTFLSSSDYHYQLLRCNVDMLKMIQLGITLSDSNGNMPKGTCTWQFNFKFSLNSDMFAQESIDLLQNSGIDFQKSEDFGIDFEHFAELMIDSGLVLLESVNWISFHSGYDFGYLLKILTMSNLPDNEQKFFSLLKTFFPNTYDIKYLMRSCKTQPNKRGGLQDVADELNVSRVGLQHQAGSDSLLTAATFFKLREKYFENIIDDSKFLGHLYGLGNQLSHAQII
ncbi:hypothetical protein BB560_002701 [Smittium megazygosporum]|uniref:poly(A)-specific ribonuclease n=1 Tax=Smittium megazygosporum TaxID=133381 RepID=A0A2T9ZE34_9FUNG|nr:hypothetical protein BB560_002701 [Smittium megazygosporum]